MKKEIHPEYFITKVSCSGCGSDWETGSTTKDIKLEICSNCHPFYTGEQKLVDTAGRVERFRKRYDKKDTTEAEAPKAEAPEAEAPKAEAPEAEAPEAEAPEAEAPEAESPEAEAPKAESPEA